MSFLKKEIRQQLFVIAYIVFLTTTIMSCYSQYGYMDGIGVVLSLLRKASLALVLFKLLLDLIARDFSIKEILFIGAVGSLLLISAYITRSISLVVYWIFIVGAHNIEFNKIIKIALIIHIATLVFTIASSYAGVIDNVIYYRYGIDKNVERESLGFTYATESSHMLFYTILLWIYYRKDKILPAEWIIMLAGIIFLYCKTDTKNAAALGMAAVAGSIILKYSTVLRNYHRWYTLIGVCIVPILAGFIIYISVIFTYDNAFLLKLNEIVTGRLQLGHSGIENYGVSLFGQPIVWNGAVQKDAVYNYVDSSYLQILLNYGISILALILTAAVATGIEIGKKKDTYLVLVLVMIAMHTTFDPHLMWPGFNTFVMVYSYFKLKENDNYTTVTDS